MTMTMTKDEANEFTGRDVDADLDTEWEVMSSEKVTPLDDKFRKVDGIPGSTMTVTFYKTYGKSRNPTTGEVVDSVHILCHEFPFFVASFPEVYEGSIIRKWKTIREYVFVDLLKYLNRQSSYGFRHLMQSTGPDRWIDDFSTYLVLR
jgi:hypothetical protein